MTGHEFAFTADYLPPPFHLPPLKELPPRLPPFPRRPIHAWPLNTTQSSKVFRLFVFWDLNLYSKDISISKKYHNIEDRSKFQKSRTHLEGCPFFIWSFCNNWSVASAEVFQDSSARFDLICKNSVFKKVTRNSGFCLSYSGICVVFNTDYLLMRSFTLLVFTIYYY